MNILTSGCFIIILVCVARGYFRGVSGIIYSLAAWIFIVVFMVCASPIAYNSLKQNEDFHDKIYNKIYPYAESYVPKISSYNTIATPERMSGYDIPDDVSESDKQKLREYLDENSTDASGLIEGIKNGSITVPDEYKSAVDTYIESGGDVTKAVDEYMKDSGKDMSDIIDDIDNGNIPVPEKYKGIVDGIKESGIDLSDIADNIKSGAENTADGIREAAIEAAVEKAVDMIMHVISVITAYLIAKIICIAVKLIMNIVTEAGPIKPAVHAAGAAMGFCEAILYIWIILYVVSLTKITPQGDVWYSMTEENQVLHYLYEHNVLKGLLNGLIN